MAIATAACLAVGGTAAFAGLALTQHAGPQGDGTGITPSGWAVTPAGVQKTAGFFPANAVLSPDGEAVLVPNIVRNANGKQTVQVLEAKDGDVLQELELDTSNRNVPQGVAPGIAFSPDGKQVFLATAGKNSILVLDWDAATKKLSVNRSIKLPSGSYPETVAVAPDGKTVYTAGQLSRRLLAVDVATGTTAQAATGDYPYGVALSEDGRTAYVSNQGGNTLSTFAVDGLTITAGQSVTVGNHPNSLLVDRTKHRIFVSNGDSDTVSVVDPATNAVTATISLAPYENAPGGTQPTNLSLSPDAATLYVTGGGNNDVSVVDVSERDSFGKIKGLIPTGWYPTAVQPTKDGTSLLITSAKGLGTGPNKGSNPTNPNDHPYIERQLKGYLSLVKTPTSDELAKYTKQVRANNGFDKAGDAGGRTERADQKTSVPRQPGEDSPIQHVIYVVKENRTYDQVFGDLGKGNGDPSLAIFGKDVTPNHHKLADQFVTLDNLYADGEVSQNGWQWATQASSNGYNEEATAQGYAGNGSDYDSEGYHPGVAAAGPDPAHAYLWDKLDQNKISFRNYGQFVVPSSWMSAQEPVKCAAGAFCAHDPVLDANSDHEYPWFDMGVSDQHRFDLWDKEFQQYKSNGNLPSMQFIDLPRDHTAGGGTAAQLVADNDLALGKIVDEVSHSQYWKNTAIFVVEDDSQGGADHVDAHRTTGLVISPYTQTGSVDSHFYSQVSMLRTMELFLGVKPMSQYDAAALPMIYSFGEKANTTPYNAVAAPGVSVTMDSTILAPGSQTTVHGKVTNSGSTALDGSTVTLTSPNGWPVDPSATQSLGSLAPGASADLAWKVSVPATATPGQQLFTVSATYPIDGRLTGTQKATLAAVVPDPRVATIPQAFVANFSSGTVSAVDLSTGKSLAEIPVGSGPGTVVTSPDHTKAFVANQNSGSVSVIDIAADAVVATIPTGKVPAGLAVSPDSKTLWVAEYGENAVQAFDAATGAAGAKVTVGAGPENLALTPDGTTLVAANKNGNTVTLVDTSSKTAKATVQTGQQPFGVAVTGDGKTAFVSDMGSNDVTPIDIATATARKAIPAGQTPFNVLLSRDGTTLYVADTGANSVTPIDVATETAKAPWTVAQNITAVALGADNATVYATAAGTGQLIPLSTATGAAGAPIKVGQYPISVAFALPVGTAPHAAAPTTTASASPSSAAPSAAAQPAAVAAPATATSPTLTPAVSHSLVMKDSDTWGNPDRADADELNREIWKALRGADDEMPAPVHAFSNSLEQDSDG
ncbi:beta-propeller fold lactonase family protein [Sinomonas sp. ASV322]|uniref:beta-propeller fold lactonase family protein n=1 Tax=Sinomonas sp. ASV322 TaxID=3041920 RepID=UPI0027DDB07A|nr:beta-propeller fold lactonase family protein [Sinomonas sp. ASV322]MDQ4504215.1 beta-propeller fold lactonase family protein [Sinomonas sp. ASV322]